MSDLSIVMEDLPRQGPGLPETTHLAYHACHDLPRRPLILDIGCGTGSQTLELAQISAGAVVAVDIHQPYLDRLNARAHQQGLQDHIRTLRASMTSLTFPDETFHLVWSEGSVFILGLVEGLSLWKRLVKRGGYLVVSDCCWFRQDAPAALRRFWQQGYPAMMEVGEALSVAQLLGFRVVDSFPLPEEAWWRPYYSEIKKRIGFLKRQGGLGTELSMDVELMEEEMALYRRYATYYGQQFFVLQRVR